MKKITTTLLLVSLIVSLHNFNAEKSLTQTKKIIKPKLGKIVDIDQDTWFDVNRIRMTVTNRGSFCWDLITGNAGLEYPKGTGKLAVFAAGLWVGGIVGEELRFIMCDYGFEYGPGIMRDETFVPDNPDFQVYKVNRGDGEENPDWLHWKNIGINFGAPVDNYGNPLLSGDQTLWTVFNDANPSLHTDGSGSTSPLGIEVQMTVFGFNRVGPVSEMVFLKWKIMNKGSDYIKDLYVGLWFDPDLGDAFNDLVGCDPENDFGFCYNADEADGVYVGMNAAVGANILKGLIDKNGNRLSMTSFGKYIGGTDPRTAREAYNYLRGKRANGSDLIDPTTNDVTMYYANGNPVTNRGWVDSAPADRRMILTSGPIEMAPGDTQEVVGTVMAAEGMNRFAAIDNLRYNDYYAQFFYEIGFGAQKALSSPEVSVFEGDREIILSWDSAIEEYNSKGFLFEGYNIYQSLSTDNLNKNYWRRIATYDIVNDINSLKGFKYYEQSGNFLLSPIQRLSNTGIKRFVKIDKDYFFEGAINNNFLTNSKPYYFAVTAFASKDGYFEEMFESEIIPTTAIPKAPKPGINYSNSIKRTKQYALHSKGRAEYSNVKVEVVNPEELKDGEYKVAFTKDNNNLRWNLLFNGSPVLVDQENSTGNYDYPLVNGLLPRVRALQSIDTYRSTETKPGSGLKLGGDAYTLGFVNGLARNIWNGGSDYAQYYGNDLEIRFSAAGSYASEYNVLGDNNSFTGLKGVPYEIWNSEDNAQLSSVYYDNEPVNGEWRIEDEDHIIIIDREYSPNSIYRPDDPAATWLLYLSKDSQWEEDDWIRIKYDNPVIPGEDEFTFKSYAPVIGDKELEKEVFKNKIRVIPNPYYGSSLYESGRHGRKIMFSPLPDKCTIRIFNLSGILLRTIEKDGTDPYVFWDLRNDHAMQVTSGIYIYIVSSIDLGETMGKIAIFIDER